MGRSSKTTSFLYLYRAASAPPAGRRVVTAPPCLVYQASRERLCPCLRHVARGRDPRRQSCLTPRIKRGGVAMSVPTLIASACHRRKTSRFRLMSPPGETRGLAAIRRRVPPTASTRLHDIIIIIISSSSSGDRPCPVLGTLEIDICVSCVGCTHELLEAPGSWPTRSSDRLGPRATPLGANRVHESGKHISREVSRHATPAHRAAATCSILPFASASLLARRVALRITAGLLGQDRRPRVRPIPRRRVRYTG